MNSDSESAADGHVQSPPLLTMRYLILFLHHVINLITSLLYQITKKIINSILHTC